MTAEQALTYGFSVTVPLEYGEAMALAKHSLAAQGFGVLTEIDVRATMKQKLGAEFRPYAILGACNPPLAHQALTAELPIGLLLPCNVIVHEGDEPGTSVVAVLDPVAQLGITGRKDLQPLAHEVRQRLQQVLERVRESGHAPAEPQTTRK